MNVLHLLPVGPIDPALLEDLRSDLLTRFRVRCEILEPRFTPEFAFHAERQQYNSSDILARMSEHVSRNCWRMLGVTSSDLYIPILTFVFGEAQLGGQCAVVSTRRLHQQFYGLPEDAALLRQRLLKEAVHELGHTLELTHCHDYYCVMASSHSVEWIDLKESFLCASCESKVLARTGSS